MIYKVLSPKDYFPKLINKLEDTTEIVVSFDPYYDSVYILIPEEDKLTVKFRQDSDQVEFAIDQNLFAVYEKSGFVTRGANYSLITDNKEMFIKQFDDLVK